MSMWICEDGGMNTELSVVRRRRLAGCARARGGAKTTSRDDVYESLTRGLLASPRLLSPRGLLHSRSVGLTAFAVRKSFSQLPKLLKSMMVLIA